MFQLSALTARVDTLYASSQAYFCQCPPTWRRVGTLLLQGYGSLTFGSAWGCYNQSRLGVEMELDFLWVSIRMSGMIRSFKSPLEPNRHLALRYTKCSFRQCGLCVIRSLNMLRLPINFLGYRRHLISEPQPQSLFSAPSSLARELCRCCLIPSST